MKNDLISRQAALKAFEEICYALWEIDIPSPTVPEYIEHHERVQSVLKLAEKWGRELRDMPAADVVEVVRCKECKNNDHGRCEIFEYCKTSNMGFCDWGKKK